MPVVSEKEGLSYSGLEYKRKSFLKTCRNSVCRAKIENVSFLSLKSKI